MAGSGKRGDQHATWDFVRHYVIPTLFLIFIPSLCLLIPLMTLKQGLNAFSLNLFLGNPFSWAFITTFVLWGIGSLKVPSVPYYGPTTPGGYTPRYSSNGMPFYCASLAVFALLQFVWPSMSATIYVNMPYIVGNLVTLAFVLCTYLLWQGRRHLQCPKDRMPGNYPIVFEFYRGLDLHPRLWGVDVKQLTNCRIGLLLWQILPLVFLITSFERHGFSAGFAANVALQTVYLAKFYWWETGYFTTLDITLDRAGFYLCWGCLVVVPSCYTYTSYYFVAHPPTISNLAGAIIFLLGSLSVYLNYASDHQKEYFRQQNGNCKIWGQKAQYIDATYRTSAGETKNTRLLCSGFWGVARHCNYTLELLLAFFWNLPGYNFGVVPFLYNVFLTGLLIHRIYRDEDKCAKKYGTYWKKYCKAVPYRMIPYIY